MGLEDGHFLSVQFQYIQVTAPGRIRDVDHILMKTYMSYFFAGVQKKNYTHTHRL